jgi:hypothetical protein
MKQRSGAISEMEKLLTMQLEDHIQKRTPFRLMIIEAKAGSLFKAVKGSHPDPNAKFVADHG